MRRILVIIAVFVIALAVINSIGKYKEQTPSTSVSSGDQTSAPHSVESVALTPTQIGF